MLRILLLVIGCTALTACMYGSATTKSGETFTNAAVKNIQPGKTTKEDILNWFGPPLAIARKAEEDKMIAVENVRADTFLELFSARRTLTDSDVVYYYRNVEIRSSGGMIGLAVIAHNQEATAKLWILIDNRNGIVEDFVTGGKQ